MEGVIETLSEALTSTVVDRDSDWESDSSAVNESEPEDVTETDGVAVNDAVAETLLESLKVSESCSEGDTDFSFVNEAVSDMESLDETEAVNDNE